MRNVALLLLAALSLGFLQGCATKTYGREEAVSEAEKTALSCHDLDLERAKAESFAARVNKESEFSGLDVLAILGDFGIGNRIEKDAALESAELRLHALREIQESRKCPVARMTPASIVAMPAA